MKHAKFVKNTTLLFSVTYMISYITRINYGAIISEMTAAEQISKTLLSMALTGSFITYGAGQIISGILGDKFSAKRLVTLGLIVTTLMNVLIPLCKGPYQMLALWCVNGFAQAFMWPPLVRLMTSLFSDEEYKRATVRVSWGSSLGTIAVYLISPLIISVSGWRAVFVASGLCSFVMTFVWSVKCPDVEKMEPVKKTEEKRGGTGVIFTPVMLGIMLAIVLQGMLRDGVTTWMPSYISETYNLSSAVSILTGVVMPLFGMACFQITSMLHRVKFKNPISCAGFIFGIGALSALALFTLSGANAAFSVLFSALLTGCMHGVNLILICMVPAYFKKYGNVSAVSGILNSCTYIGSALSTYGIAVVSENIGWKFTILLWFGIAAAGTAVCLVCVKPWKKKFILKLS